MELGSTKSSSQPEVMFRVPVSENMMLRIRRVRNETPQGRLYGTSFRGPKVLDRSIRF